MSEQRIPDTLLSRLDDAPDALFYREPRFVTHVDAPAIDALTALYRERLPEHGAILDLMSSWVSHLPAEVVYRRVAGLGMNREELAANPRLTERVVQDLNADPRLPFEDEGFDAVLIALSVQYLVRPLEAFADIRRVLRPSGECLIAVSHRLFPTKAVALFRTRPAREWPRLVESYFERAGGFEVATRLDRSPRPTGSSDPLWFVVASRSPAITARR